jgi:hypothetical protein
MTRDELLSKLAVTRARKIVLTWAQFTSAVAGADDALKAQILAAANMSNGRALFTIINGLTVAKKLELARAEVDAVAADDSLTINELIALLG